jgi:large subunit ribosomal protein L7/L12
MAVSKEDILETLSNMTVMEVVDLIAAMEEKFGCCGSGCRCG